MTDGTQDAPPAGGALGPLGRVIQRLSSKGEGGAYQGFLSYAAEWHAFVLGLGVGLAGGPDLEGTLVAYALGRGGGKRLGDSAHVRDVADEPAYALAGLAVGKSARGGLTAPEVML
jgi:hypothetical protein